MAVRAAARVVSDHVFEGQVCGPDAAEDASDHVAASKRCADAMAGHPLVAARQPAQPAQPAHLCRTPWHGPTGCRRAPRRRAMAGQQPLEEAEAFWRTQIASGRVLFARHRQFKGDPAGNWEKPEPSTEVRAGDKVRVDTHHHERVVPAATPVLLAETDDIVVVDKPAGPSLAPRAASPRDLAETSLQHMCCPLAVPQTRHSPLATRARTRTRAHQRPPSQGWDTTRQRRTPWRPAVGSGWGYRSSSSHTDSTCP